MRVSFNQSSKEKVRDKNGFGYAAKMCKQALADLGHEVTWRDPAADVEINFIQPQLWHWSGVDYRIGYVPWESTTMPEGWVEAMNEVDEVWTPSPVIAQWFADEGVTKPIRVYEHGVESLWAPRLRTPARERFRTFHHGAEALRKGGEMAFASHQRALWEEYATFVAKAAIAQWAIRGSLRLEIHTGHPPIDKLVELYHSVHCMIYPSWGEGFGLTPLQAMATGMPVIVTQGWAPYEYLLGDHNLIKSELVDSPWQDVHPGQMFKPDFDDLCDKVRYQWENRERMAVEAFELTKRVREDYDWLTLTDKAFAHLV